MIGRIGLWLALTRLWLSTFLHQLATTRRDDRGDSPVSTAVIVVGLVLIAGIVVAIIREKAIDTANNICTNADPTTCK
ncbi:hypothetical protein [Protofrankia symbiont of Coriaria ruscifolia]|uniref:hypothetical protein n=1 Tax=Protofrankia symbiont of Coriaria ruscifolia TaxID=1306542 RepID=UPI0010410DB4|nr:hypothetical protein [Protofrankia symbiont of Coriaria ruscifolia]